MAGTGSEVDRRLSIWSSKDVVSARGATPPPDGWRRVRSERHLAYSRAAIDMVKSMERAGHAVAAHDRRGTDMNWAIGNRVRAAVALASVLLLSVGALGVSAESPPPPPPPPPPPFLDATPPVVSAPSHRFVAPSSVANGVVIHVSWSATDASGIAAYHLVAQTFPGPVVTRIELPNPAQTSVDLRVAPNTSYRFGVQATDVFGNTSLVRYGPVIKVAVFEEATAVFVGHWSRVTSANASGGSYRRTSAVGASATFTVTGRHVALVAQRGPLYGSAKVYVDGRSIGTVTLLNRSTANRTVVLARDLAAGRHTVRVVRASGTIDVDDLMVIGN
jgi:hypothetical protein